MAEIVYVPKAPHVCDLPRDEAPPALPIRPGTIVRCPTCGAFHELEGAHYEQGPHSVAWVSARWRRLDWTEVFWRRLTGRIPMPPEPETTETMEVPGA